jgi:hypothetical protein
MGGPPTVYPLSPAMQRACLEAMFHGAGMQMTRPSRTRTMVAFVFAVWLFVSLSVCLSVWWWRVGIGGLQLRHYQAGMLDGNHARLTGRLDSVQMQVQVQVQGDDGWVAECTSCGEAGWAGWSRHLPCGLCLVPCALRLVPWSMAGQSWIGRVVGYRLAKASIHASAPAPACASPQLLRRWAARSLQPIICHPAHPPSAKVTSERWAVVVVVVLVVGNRDRGRHEALALAPALALALTLVFGISIAISIGIPCRCRCRCRCRWPELGCLSSARLVSRRSLAFPFPLLFLFCFLSPALVLMPFLTLTLLSLHLYLDLSAPFLCLC